jgi:iduronate 2-sulfatase
MGYSVRTPSARYTEWREWGTGKITDRELYEHKRDPHELNNSVDKPTEPAALAAAVSALHQQFPPGMPPAER